MDREQQMRINSLLNSFHPLEGFEGRVHGRYIQGHMRDPNTEYLADMCCWVEHKHLCQLHNFFPENLKKTFNTVNSGMYGLGVKKKKQSEASNL